MKKIYLIAIALFLLFGLTEIHAQQSWSSSYSQENLYIIKPEVVIGNQYDILARGKIIVSGKIITDNNDSISILDGESTIITRIAKIDILKQVESFKKEYVTSPKPLKGKIKLAIINHKNYISSFSCKNLTFINDTTFICSLYGLNTTTSFNLSEINSIFKTKEYPILYTLSCINLGGLIYGLTSFSVLPYFLLGGLIITPIYVYNTQLHPTYQIIYNDKNNVISKSDYKHDEYYSHEINHITKDVWQIIENVDNDFILTCQENSLKGYFSFFKKYNDFFYKYPYSINYYQGAYKAGIKQSMDLLKTFKIGSTKISDFEKIFDLGFIRQSYNYQSTTTNGDGGTFKSDYYIGGLFGKTLCRVVFEGPTDGLNLNSVILKSIDFYK